MPSNGQRRANAWYRDPKLTDESRLFLAINDLDELDDSVQHFHEDMLAEFIKVRAEMREASESMNFRMNWLIGLVFGVLVALISVLFTVVLSS